MTGTDSVAELGKRLNILDAQFKKGGEGAARFALEINTTKDALKLLSDSTTRLHGLQDQLGRSMDSLRSKLGLGEDIMSGSNADAAKHMQDLNNGRVLAQRGTVAGMGEDQRMSAMRGLKAVEGIKDPFQTGERGTGKDILERITRNQFGGKAFAPEDKEIGGTQNAILSVLKDSADSSKVLADYEGKLFSSLCDRLDQSNRQFLQGMGQLMGKDLKAPDGAKLAPFPQLPNFQLGGFAANNKQLGVGLGGPKGNGAVAERAAALGMNTPEDLVHFGRFDRESLQNKRTRAGEMYQANKQDRSISFDRNKLLRGGMAPQMVDQRLQGRETEAFMHRARGMGYSQNQIKALRESNGDNRQNGQAPKPDANIPNKVGQGEAFKVPSIDLLQKSFTMFDTTVKEMVASLTKINIPPKIDVAINHTLTCVFNGAEAFQAMIPQIKEIAMNTAVSALSKYNGDLLTGRNPGTANTGAIAGANAQQIA
jgi:hypothetical protein